MSNSLLQIAYTAQWLAYGAQNEELGAMLTGLKPAWSGCAIDEGFPGFLCMRTHSCHFTFKGLPEDVSHIAILLKLASA